MLVDIEIEATVRMAFTQLAEKIRFSDPMRSWQIYRTELPLKLQN